LAVWPTCVSFNMCLLENNNSCFMYRLRQYEVESLSSKTAAQAYCDNRR